MPNLIEFSFLHAPSAVLDLFAPPIKILFRQRKSLQKKIKMVGALRSVLRAPAIRSAHQRIMRKHIHTTVAVQGVDKKIVQEGNGAQPQPGQKVCSVMRFVMIIILTKLTFLFLNFDAGHRALHW